MLNDFIKFLEQQVKNHSIYVWGGQGQKASESIIERMEENSTNRKRALALYKKNLAAGYKSMQIFDCSGLGCYFLYNLNRLIPSDTTANGLLNRCEKLTKKELKRGDWVFRVYTSGSKKGKAYHIGYVVDSALNVIEAQGRDYGVVKRGINAGGSRYWNAFGRPLIFKAEIEKEDEEMKVIQKTAKSKIAEIYDATGKREIGRYIAKGDKCKITNIMTDSLLIPVEYPIKKGTRKAFIKSLEKF